MSKVCLACHADSRDTKCQMSPMLLLPAVKITEKKKNSQFSGVPISYPPIKGLTEQNGEGDQGEGHQLPERQRPDPGHTGWGHRRGDFWPESSDARRYVCTLTYQMPSCTFTEFCEKTLINVL